jgi:uncharacterized protein YfaT (DUF1175 family)
MSRSVMNIIRQLDVSWCQSKALLKKQSFNRSANNKWAYIHNSVQLYVKRKYPVNPEESEKLPGNIHMLNQKNLRHLYVFVDQTFLFRMHIKILNYRLQPSV